MTESSPNEQTYIETPRGILSRGGLVFHTVRSELERQYGDVLKEVSLEDLIERAGLWLHSHRAIAIWAMIPLLAYMPVGIACVLGLVVFLLWKLIAPALGTPRLEKAVRLLSSVPGQLVGYVIALSWLGSSGNYPALIAGLVAFALIRWQVLDYVLGPVTRYLYKRLYPLPVADQMLRAVIHAMAIKMKIILPQFPSMARWMSEKDGGAEA